MNIPILFVQGKERNPVLSNRNKTDEIFRLLIAGDHHEVLFDYLQNVINAFERFITSKSKERIFLHHSVVLKFVENDQSLSIN